MASIQCGKRSARVIAATSLLALSAASLGQAPADAPAAAHKRPHLVATGVKTPGITRPLAGLVPDVIYPVAGSPDWSVVTPSATWITSARANHVVQLLPTPNPGPDKAGKVGLIVELDKPCSGLAGGWGSIWVPTCGKHVLSRVDEKTGKVTAEIPADPANSEGGIAIGDGSVWLVTKPSTLIRVDPKKNAVVSTLDLPSESEDPVFGGGFVWISSNGHDSLLKVDPKSNKIVATIPVGAKPRFLTVGEGSVWVLNQGDGTITRVDMKTNKVLATIDCGLAGFGGDITYGAGSIWATLYDFPLTQIDPKTNLPVKQWTGKGGDGMRFGNGSIWLSNGGQQTVWRLSPDQK